MPADIRASALSCLPRSTVARLQLSARWLAAWAQRRRRLLALLALLAAAAGALLLAISGSTWRRAPQPRASAPLLRTGRDHLILYAFSYSDSEALHNLVYFVREAVLHDAVADAIIIVQEGPTLLAAELPELPAHAAYVRHANECYDWGSYGWLLFQTGLVDVGQYRYFFFVNSSVRGPFLPAYARGSFHWMTAFTSRLNEDVKLVGSTISCEGSPLHGKRHGRWRRNPHVQSYAFATDATGLAVLRASRPVFACQRDRWDTIYHAELGSSAAILAAGFNLDCLMLRYQGVDWRDKANWHCNGGVTPTFEFSNDGSSVEPLEVLFVKVKAAMLASGISHSKKAAKYTGWQAQSAAWAGGREAPPPADPHPSQAPLAATTASTSTSTSSTNYSSLSSNEYLDELHRFKAPRVLAARARGAACFDFSFYAKESPDLRPLWGDPIALWRHWVYYGQFDLRPHKWTCDVDYTNISSWPS